MKSKTILMTGIGIALFLITLISVFAKVEILDPSGDVQRELGEEILVTVNIEGDPLMCWYDLIVNKTFFDCERGINQFPVTVDYIGLNQLTVYMKDSNADDYKDSLDFEIIGTTSITKESPGPTVNADTLFCVEGSNCLWDSDNFVEYFLLVIIIAVVIIIYLDQGDTDGKKG